MAPTSPRRSQRSRPVAPVASESINGVPFVPWADFFPRFRWRQGEHVALVGPTGQGKTTLGLQLATRRDWVVVVATKPKDRTLSGLAREGYIRTSSWPPPALAQRVVLWPVWRDSKDNRAQSAAIREAINAIYRSGSWCIFTDDVQHLTAKLRLGDELDTLWLQARALGISVMAATQRPRHVPRTMWTQSTHVFVWGTADEDDLKQIGGMGGISSKLVRSVVAELPRFHALYLDTRRRKMAITKAPERR